jgi:hypothetical protein
MKLEDLKIGAVIMHADARTNPIHTGTMYIVLKIDKEREDIEVCCVNCQIGTAIGEVRHISTRSISEYNMLFQILIAPPAVSSNPTNPSKDLYLRWGFVRKSSLGKIGEKTPYKLENGRNLVVGDTVKISREGKEYGACLVVHDSTDGYYIMGIAADCNDRKCEIKHWNVTLESGFYNRLKGDTYTVGNSSAVIEVVDFKSEEE